MGNVVFLFSLLVSCGATTEYNRLSIYAYKEDEIILRVPEHLLDETEYIIWKKGNDHIATSLGNGSLHVLDPGYRDILSSFHDGSLIIKALSWEDREEYSANITYMTHKGSTSIYYQVKVYNSKFIPHEHGPIALFATAGENLTLPLEDNTIKESEIEEIDWLTEKWVYFAATKIGGEIRILENVYVGGLSSSDNGSLVFTKVTKKDEGIYRACIFSHQGKIFERKYQVHISGPSSESYMERFTSSMPESFSELLMIILSGTCIFFCLSVSCVIMIHMKCKGKKTTHSLNQEEMVTLSGQVDNNKAKISQDKFPI